MAQHLVELCGILVDESFGDTAALIWSHLAQHGRTQFAGLARIAKVRYERLAQLLPILVLNRVIVYYIDPDYNATWYSVSLEGAYNLLRMSRLSEVVKERCGADAEHLIVNMAQLGHITVGELASAYNLRPKTLTISKTAKEGVHANASAVRSDMDTSKHSNAANGNGEANVGKAANGASHLTDTVNGTKHINGDLAERDVSTISTLEQLYAAVTALIRGGFLIKTNPVFFQTEYDLQQILEKKVQEEQFSDGRITGPKASQQYNLAVRERKRKQREADFDVDSILSEGARSQKRQRIFDGASGGHPHHLDDNLILTINARKYVVALRSKAYVRLATSYLGSSSGAVYNTLLQALEKQIPEVALAQRFLDPDTRSEDEDDTDLYNPRATVTELYNIIDRSVDLTSSIKVSAKDLPAPVDNKPAYRQVKEDFSSIGIKPEPESEDDGATGLDSFANRSKMCDLIERHLQSIELHPKQFCQREGLGKPSVWSVDFPDLTDSLILSEIDNSITARFGKLATRIVRLLRDKGKVEERHISAHAFMQMKDVRFILTELYAAGYVEAQELAKDSTRQPAKALYLWYFDTPKVQRMMIHQCYQSMSRAYQRLASERERFKTVIAKAQRLAEASFYGDHYTPAHDEDAEEGQADGEQERSSSKPVRFVLGTTGLWQSEALNVIEKQQIDEWKAIEANFLGQIMRLDDVILVLRDFSGQYTMTSA